MPVAPQPRRRGAGRFQEIEPRIGANMGVPRRSVISVFLLAVGASCGESNEVDLGWSATGPIDDSWSRPAPESANPNHVWLPNVPASSFSQVLATKEPSAELMLSSVSWRRLSPAESVELTGKPLPVSGNEVIVLLRGVGRQMNKSTEKLSESVSISWEDGVVRVLNTNCRKAPMPPARRRPIVAVLPREPTEVYVESATAIMGALGN
jgi:hypothetical protein